MADPTIQTFCCHHGNGTDMAITIMNHFNTDSYNIVCLFSSTVGILGALYQVSERNDCIYFQCAYILFRFYLDNNFQVITAGYPFLQNEEEK